MHQSKRHRRGVAYARMSVGPPNEVMTTRFLSKCVIGGLAKPARDKIPSYSAKWALNTRFYYVNGRLLADFCRLGMSLAVSRL